MTKPCGTQGSPAGKALVPARKAELEEFLKQLKHETENLNTL